MLAVDLGFDGRRRRALTLRAAALWSGAWIALGVLFGLVVFARYGSAAVVTYVTAYLLEKSLSLDNLFVFALIFGQLAIPAEHQRRVLSWGILGALAMRGLLIAAGISLLERFHWVLYPFAAVLLLAAARLVWGEDRERKMVVAACAVCGSWVARFLPVTPVIRDGRFWIRQGGGVVATPLFIALVVVETSDAVFALDSIPAVLAVTREPFLVYTSNAFAMLGLRSLYFVLAGALERFHALRYALAAILAFVAAKILLGRLVEVPSWVSLTVIVVAVAGAVAASTRGPVSRVDEGQQVGVE
jgi:tellurite resistance protein TerC